MVVFPKSDVQVTLGLAQKFLRPAARSWPSDNFVLHLVGKVCVNKSEPQA
jgi:hypothetical protein